MFFKKRIHDIVYTPILFGLGMMYTDANIYQVNSETIRCDEKLQRKWKVNSIMQITIQNIT